MDRIDKALLSALSLVSLRLASEMVNLNGMSESEALGRLIKAFKQLISDAEKCIEELKTYPPLGPPDFWRWN